MNLLSSMSQTFEYKCAPLGGNRVLIVGDSSAQLRKSSGEEKGSIEYAEIDGARYVTHQVRDAWMRRLDLHAGENLFRVHLNVMRGTSESEPPVSTFYKGCVAILQAISKHKPELEVEIGEGGRVRMVWFLLGVFCLLVGVGLPLIAILTGVDWDRILTGIIPMGLMAFFGYYGVRMFWPGRKPPSATIDEMIGVFEGAVSDDGSSE